MTDQARVLRDMARAAASGGGHAEGTGRGGAGARIIAVSSGKGGVGKTSLSVNLGVKLARKGQRVALVDADIGLGNVHIVLGLDATYTLRHVWEEQRSWREVLVPGPGGLQVVVGGSGVQELDRMGDMRLEKIISTFDELDEMFDTVLIDTGAGLGAHVLGFVQSSPETVIVVTPDPSSVADAYALMKTVSLRNANNRLFVAVNMARSVRQGQQTFERLAQVAGRFLKVEPIYIGTVVRDEAVARATRRQTAFVLDSPRSSAARAIGQIAGRLAADAEVGEDRRGFGGFMRRMFSGRF